MRVPGRADRGALKVATEVGVAVRRGDVGSGRTMGGEEEVRALADQTRELALDHASDVKADKKGDRVGVHRPRVGEETTVPPQKDTIQVFSPPAARSPVAPTVALPSVNEPAPKDVSTSLEGLSPTKRLIHGALGLPVRRVSSSAVVSVAPEATKIAPSTPARKTMKEATGLPTPEESPEGIKAGDGARSDGDKRTISGGRAREKADAYVRDAPKIQVRFPTPPFSACLMKSLTGCALTAGGGSSGR